MGIRGLFFKIYWKIQGIITPGLRYSQYIYEDFLNYYVNEDIKWLDLGCGHQILPPWRSKKEKELIESCKLIVGIDFDLNSLKKHKNIFFKIKGDITKLPFKDNFFNLVTANMVVEHLDNPEIQFNEVRRILKPGGIFIFHTPNVLGYPTIAAKLVPKILKKKLIYLLEGRREEDIFDTFYRANSKLKIKNLANKAGFKVVIIKMIVSTAELAIITPIAIFELILIRILMMKPFKIFRPYIISILKNDSNKQHAY